MALEQWLAECSAEDPAGIALDYDPEFMALEKLVQGEPERQYGDVIIAAKEPDWRAVLQIAESLLARSKDFRITGALAHALVALRGISGLVEALQLTVALLRDRWDEAHPRMVLDGEADPVPRTNALATLADVSGLLATLRATTFVSHGGMKLSLRDVENALSMVDVNGPIDREHLTQLLKDRLAADPKAFDDLRLALELASQCVMLCNEKMGLEHAPDLQQLTQVLTNVERGVAPLRRSGDNVAIPYGDASGEAGPDAVRGSPQRMQPDVPGARWAVRSRRDVIDMIDAACAYFDAHEPSSPVPVLLQRARQLTGMRYIDIVRNLTPDSLSAVESIAGRTES